MGQPMALNLARAGVPLTVWNRTESRCAPLVDLGAHLARTPAEVFAAASTIILMMRDTESLDAVLGRGSAQFAENVAGRVIVNMGTFEPDYSLELEADIMAADGAYVEAPVSGSRGPAEAGELVVMLAGRDPAVMDRVREIIAPISADAVTCGPVPAALNMKLTVNGYMISMITALAESVHFANRRDVDLDALARVLEAGPMNNALARVKLRKIIDADLEPQAAITDVLKNSKLIADAARESGIVSPLIDDCVVLYGETAQLGFGNLDMVAVLKAFEARTATN